MKVGNVLIALVAFIAGVGAYSLWVGYRWLKSQAPGCAIIHQPKTGCPSGWTEMKDFFTEADGSKRNACHAPENSGLPPCVDYLAPGESMQIRIGISFDQPKDKT